VGLNNYAPRGRSAAALEFELKLPCLKTGTPAA
jgi:hypothetical protein